MGPPPVSDLYLPVRGDLILGMVEVCLRMGLGGSSAICTLGGSSAIRTLGGGLSELSEDTPSGRVVPPKVIVGGSECTLIRPVILLRSSRWS